MPQSQTVALPKRLPLVTRIQTRNPTGNKDGRLINCFAELDPQMDDFWVEKRVGLQAYQTFGGIGLGSYNWKNNVYSVYGSTLFKNNTSFGTVDATSSYTFIPILSGTPKLFIKNNSKAYYTDGTTLTQVVDVNYPASTVPGASYLDGTIYVMDSSAKIYGTANLDDPSTWDPLNVIVARIEPDEGVFLAKHLSYVIAFKQWTTEVFYDADNPTGSPLGAVQGAQAQLGCVAAGSVQEIDGTLLWLTSNRTASAQAARMDALNVQVISTPPIERLLDEADFTTVYSFVLKHGGHRFYVVTIKNENLTLVYDLDQDLWYEWTAPGGTYWPFVSATYNTSAQHILQHETSGTSYLADGDYAYTTDAGAIIPVKIYTPPFDGGTSRRKHMGRLSLNGDQVPGSIVTMQWSDDDYQTWNPPTPMSFDMSTTSPFVPNLGTFVRRTFLFQHNLATAFRIKSSDLQLDLGTL